MASRRGSEELITDGRVRLNGQVVIELGTKMIPGQDRVELDGRPVRQVETQWVALHKPGGYVTTRDDPEGRRTVYDLLPSDQRGLFHVGRLDRASRGLLLLTNDGELAHRLTHPRFGVEKEYVVDVEGRVDEEVLHRLVEGVELEDGTAYAEIAEAMRVAPQESRLRLVLREGRNREVRRMMEAVGHPVLVLVRRRFGPVKLGAMPTGAWRALDGVEIQALRVAAGIVDGQAAAGRGSGPRAGRSGSSRPRPRR